MASHALDQRLFEDTANTLTEPEVIAPTDGVQLINGWLKVIDGNNSAEVLETRLKELRGQLQVAKPDPDRIRDLLMTLADHTDQIAQGRNVQQQTAGKLVNVATSLRLFAEKL